ncbi:hypothetical protein [Sinorhizobium meliloti]|uniref:hypothetical protein n=1 Tax=Rhizobium meliloti TaxID=382 RepID=UPI000FDA3D04|nr:hypothetical protein [Sinorhizobium meliloti]RVP99644.1 hypothetical protein CN070_16895 [Sinorhizobium meliloti]
MHSFTYDEILKSKRSKYDIALKSFMLSQDSELRKLLELPAGTAFAAEITGYDGRAVDTVVDGPAVYHIEFQTKDIDEMPWRMLEYYWLLFRQFSLDFKMEREIIQILVYVGSDDDPTKMLPPLRKDRITFGYGWRDLRDLGERSSIDLLRSPKPFDWILRVLCYRKVPESVWLKVAQKVNDFCEAERHKSQNLRVHLLVAMALRKLEYPLARRMCDMLEVDMKSVPAFKEAVDDAEYNGLVKGVAHATSTYLEKHGYKKPELHRWLYQLPLERIQELMNECFAATNRDELSSALRSKLNEFGFSFS